jgi:hypothetical protein
VVTRTVIIGTGLPDELTYLPLILKASATATGAETPALTQFELKVVAGAPGQVTGLSGDFQSGGLTSLAWQLNPAADQLLGYRVYRSSQAGFAFLRLADLPATATTYTDTGAACELLHLTLPVKN